MARLFAALGIGLFCFLAPVALMAQSDDCEAYVYTDSIDVTTTAPAIEVEQFEIQLHQFHIKENKCTNWFEAGDGVYTLGGRCSTGSTVSMVQGEVRCDGTSGPSNGVGCRIYTRLRCGTQNRIVDLRCRPYPVGDPLRPQGSWPQATIDIDERFVQCSGPNGSTVIGCSNGSPGDLTRVTCPRNGPCSAYNYSVWYGTAVYEE